MYSAAPLLRKMLCKFIVQIFNSIHLSTKFSYKQTAGIRTVVLSRRQKKNFLNANRRNYIYLHYTTRCHNINGPKSQGRIECLISMGCMTFWRCISVARRALGRRYGTRERISKQFQLFSTPCYILFSNIASLVGKINLLISDTHIYVIYIYLIYT